MMLSIGACGRLSRALAATLLFASACEQTDTEPHLKAGEAPQLVTIAAGTLEAGFTRGELRAKRSINAYSITKYPISWTQYDQCVHAGACAPPPETACLPEAYRPFPAYRLPDLRLKSKQTPATCVGGHNAEAYCKWVGGRLPTTDEWLAAARGAAPHRFSWGDELSCHQHPFSSQLIAHLTRGMIPGDQTLNPSADAIPCDADWSKPVSLDIGHHPLGASPTGVQDVLLTPGEMVRGDSESSVGACGDDNGLCVVFGIDPGAIDSVEADIGDGKPSQSEGGQGSRSITHAYGFRCVLSLNAGDRT